MPKAAYMTLTTPEMPFLDYWRYPIPRQEIGIDPEFFPTAHNWEKPLGTKGGYVSPEAALRWVRWGDYAGAMKKYAKERNAHMIGEGSVAPPPCWPQPFCALWEGEMPGPDLLALIPASRPLRDHPSDLTKEAPLRSPKIAGNLFLTKVSESALLS
eukprot:TRINITY_DN15856_c2_g1_i1.p1 TRINITY_DN15856_c2_g1~~TRINITY_DN15856_c2_g1_i1.p1  ORF type:complete len:156 (-),score=23.27 TRINITY_DN15856_c2_g1_i1:127-594(-)